MKCEWKDWSENIDKVNEPLLLLYARNLMTTKGYTGKQFVFCPWCGKELITEEQEN